MGNRILTRKDFIKLSSATAVALTFAPNCFSPQPDKQLDPKDLPIRQLGNTDIFVPIIGIGCGSRFLSIESDDETERILNYAIDHGIYYWDTAADYELNGRISEVRLGRVLRYRRREVWLSTKVSARDGEGAEVQIERSLKRLQTDYLDELKIHSIQSLDDVEEIVKKGNVLSIIQKLKEEGVVKYIGFSGHSSAQAMIKLAKEYEFDTMLIAMNHYGSGDEPFERMAIPTAADKGMGILVMKVVRPRESFKDVTAEELIRYALSLDQVDCAIVGTDSIEILMKNIALIKDFQPLDQKRMEELQVSLNPFFNHKDVEWMMPHYRDGMWT